ncbi:MAG: hypothetical protein ACLSHC_07380 [Bilophila wadsworthia]
MSAELGIEVVLRAASRSGEGAGCGFGVHFRFRHPLIEDNWPGGSLLTLSSRVRFEDSYLKRARIWRNWKMHQAYRDEGQRLPPEERLIPHQRIHELIAEGQIRESSILEWATWPPGIAAARSGGWADRVRPTAWALKTWLGRD